MSKIKNICTAAIFGAFFALGSFSIGVHEAKADVCFLPDPAMCGGGLNNFWPTPPATDSSNCDASYNKEASLPGYSCVKCGDANSIYFGLYKCGNSPVANCDGYTDLKSTNGCGQACTLCTVPSEPNYGKYKCPPVLVGGCSKICSECTYTEEDARTKMENDPCTECAPCDSLDCTDEQKGKWRCETNQECKQCHAGGYTENADSQRVKDFKAFLDRNVGCSAYVCSVCGSSAEQQRWYSCGNCTVPSNVHEKALSQISEESRQHHCNLWNCGCLSGYVRCDDCVDYNVSPSSCTGDTEPYGRCPAAQQGWAKGCCNKCTGYEYNNATKPTGASWECESCEGCDGKTHYKCVDTCKGGYTSKVDEGKCWSYSEKCVDGTGTQHYNRKIIKKGKGTNMWLQVFV